MKRFLKNATVLVFFCVPFFNTQAYGEFMMTINTDPNGSNDSTITIPTNPNYAPNYTVDWGDGNTDSGLIGDASHTYATAGTYQILISGNIGGLYINNTTGIKEKIVSVDQWGTIQWLSMERAFAGVPSLTINAVDTPNLSQVTDMSYIFANIPTFLDAGGQINNWNTSTIQTLEGAFVNGGFNADISGWNVSNVTNMIATFSGAISFNQNISNWTTSAVTNMQQMFQGATSFNQPIGGWNTGNVTSMQGMFASASSFNQTLSWNTTNVTDMSSMFEAASSFNSSLFFDTSNVTNMSYMFHEAINFSQSLYFYTNKVQNMSYMFADTLYNDNSITGWNTATTTDMSYMFARNSAFNQNISNWNTGKVTNMQGMFQDAISFNQNISSWNTANVTDMSTMFSGATSFSANIGSWNVSKVTNFSYMFSAATAFNIDLSSWNTASSTAINGMFANTNFNQPLNSWNVSSVEQMSDVFYQASSFNQPLSNWNTSHVTNMTNMFYGASSFNQDLSSWNFEAVNSIDDFLRDANMSYINYDKLLEAWDTQNTQNGLSTYVSNGLYCNSTSYRSHLILTKGWSIIDVGTPVGCPAPYVVNVTSPNADRNYVTGETITIQVVFSEPVNVGSGGAPILQLRTGTSSAITANLVGGGNGTHTLTFSFVVSASHNSTDLQYLSTSALVATIEDVATSSLPANTTLPALNSVNSLGGNKNITINQTAPVVSTSSPAQAQTNSWFGATSFGGTIENIKPAGTCNDFVFKKSLKLGQKDKEVVVIKKFLNKNLGTKLNSNTVFDKATQKAVIRFQEKYRKDILEPTRLKKGTGMWYSATIKKANQLECGK